MKILIAEDDFTSRLLLQKLLEPYGECHIAVNGNEAVAAFGSALADGAAYTLVCLDVMMPEKDGQAALREMRALEKSRGVPPGLEAKIVMTTALADAGNVRQALGEHCHGYFLKPIDKKKLIGQLKKLGLID